jgi:hypothetical protein
VNPIWSILALLSGVKGTVNGSPPTYDSHCLVIAEPQIHVRFVVDEVALVRVFFFFGFPLVIRIPPFCMLIYQRSLRRAITLAGQHVVRFSVFKYGASCLVP